MNKKINELTKQELESLAFNTDFRIKQLTQEITKLTQDYNILVNEIMKRNQEGKKLKPGELKKDEGKIKTTKNTI